MATTNAQFTTELAPAEPLHAGTFALQQFGTMDGGEPELVYLVTPGSGTGDVAGLRGVVELEVVEGVHRVVFEYAL